jgi:crotonobetainyl-CoA:carnitine CoA-transferase CaiB-like acyl-CoA transferase
MDHRDYGKILFPQGAIASVLGTRLSPAPRLGEHNQQILKELLCTLNDIEMPNAANSK